MRLRSQGGKARAGRGSGGSAGRGHARPATARAPTPTQQQHQPCERATPHKAQSSATVNPVQHPAASVQCPEPGHRSIPVRPKGSFVFAPSASNLPLRPESSPPAPKYCRRGRYPRPLHHGRRGRTPSLVHANSPQGYGFPYDDVSPAGQPPVDGSANDSNPTRWHVTVG
ncbi:beta-1,3-glucanase family protein [Streptomyces wuyuanensis]|uniref:beta-1,3-glucanase family protein n=1 Tax=Streptomyces wuyuanensis TaxID=1196353 RepID=UPI00371F3D07